DSGSYQHLTGIHPSKWDSYEELSQPFTLSAVSGPARVIGQGSLRVTFSEEGHHTTVTLNNIGFIPNLPHNLISTVRLRKDASVYTDLNNGTFFNESGRILGRFNDDNYVPTCQLDVAPPALAATRGLSMEVWHK